MINGLILRKTTSYIYKPNSNIIRINPVALLHKSSSRAADSKDIKDSKAQVLKNESITYPNLRVVYTDELTGKNEWKIMNRDEAVSFAKQKSLDLVLVNEKADPPVCKLAKYHNLVTSIKKKEKENRKKQKLKSLKEMLLTAGIEPRDFAIKINKVKEFLFIGHTVKVTIVAKKFTKNKRFKDGVRRDRMAGFDETVLMLLESIENLPILVIENKVKRNPLPPPPTNATRYKNLLDKIKLDESIKQKETSEDGDEDDDDKDKVVAEFNPFTGQRIVIRREFVLSPKITMKSLTLDSILSK